MYHDRADDGVGEVYLSQSNLMTATGSTSVPVEE
jgi:hypothetical protein